MQHEPLSKTHLQSYTIQHQQRSLISLLDPYDNTVLEKKKKNSLEDILQPRDLVTPGIYRLKPTMSCLQPSLNRHLTGISVPVTQWQAQQ